MSVNKTAPTVSRWIGASAIVVLASAIAGIIVISSGLFDPQPIGPLTFEVPLEQHTISSESERIVWLDFPGIGDSYTLRLKAAHTGPPADVGYGLAIGSPEEHLVVGVSPLGYVTIWTASPVNQSGGSASGKPKQRDLMPWQTWPHVRTDSASNELWLDVESGRLASVRLNRELLWDAGSPLSGGRVGLWMVSYAQPSTIDFQLLQLFSPD